MGTTSTAITPPKDDDDNNVQTQRPLRLSCWLDVADGFSRSGDRTEQPDGAADIRLSETFTLCDHLSQGLNNVQRQRLSLVGGRTVSQS